MELNSRKMYATIAVVGLLIVLGGVSRIVLDKNYKFTSYIRAISNAEVEKINVLDLGLVKDNILYESLFLEENLGKAEDVRSLFLYDFLRELKNLKQTQNLTDDSKFNYAMDVAMALQNNEQYRVEVYVNFEDNIVKVKSRHMNAQRYFKLTDYTKKLLLYIFKLNKI